jgi:hypothetical protein
LAPFDAESRDMVLTHDFIIEYTMATATICDPCQSRNIVKTSVSWCMECEEELCSECTEYHTNLKITRLKTNFVFGSDHYNVKKAP